MSAPNDDPFAAKSLGKQAQVPYMCFSLQDHKRWVQQPESCRKLMPNVHKKYPEAGNPSPKQRIQKNSTKKH